MSDIGSHAGSRATASRAVGPVYTAGAGIGSHSGSRAKNRYDRPSGQLGGGLETVVRNFVSVESKPRPKTTPEAPPKEVPEAFLRWGTQSAFQDKSFRNQATGVLHRSIRGSSGEDDDPEPLKRRRETYSEEGRTWEDIKVLNSSSGDPENYLMVRDNREVAVSGWFGDCRDPEARIVDRNGVTLANEAQFLFNIGVHSIGDKRGSGQNPKSPPVLDELNENEAYLEWRDRHLL